MPHAYFEVEGLDRLQRAYDRALAILEKRQSIPAEIRNILAARIFSFAADGGHSEEAILRAALNGLVPAETIDTHFPNSPELPTHPEP